MVPITIVFMGFINHLITGGPHIVVFKICVFWGGMCFTILHHQHSARQRDRFAQHAVDDVEPSMQGRVLTREQEIWEPSADPEDRHGHRKGC
jgi:hypothetical protein